MELLKEILIKVFEKEEINITFPNLKIDITGIAEAECYEALKKLRLSLKMAAYRILNV